MPQRRGTPLSARLDELARKIPALQRITAYSQPGEEDRRAGRFQREGRLDLSVLAGALSRRPLAYLCGSPGFISATTEELLRRGMPRFDIFAEAFSAAAEIPRELKPRKITLAGTQRSFDWTPAAGAILDAALAADIPLPSGCRAGQCESCTVRVIEGSFAHLVAFDGEPDQCLTCQAVPLSDLVISA